MSGRNLLWDAAWVTFKEHPLTGIGFGGFERWYAAFYAGNRGAAYLTHNIYYGMLAETGAVGTFLFCTLFSWGIVSTARTLVAARRLEHGHVSDYVLVVSLALQIWFIAYGFTGNGIYDANEMFFFVIALVMNLSVRHAMRIEELDSRPPVPNSMNGRLVTCDLVCAGAPSPGLWSSFLAWVEARTGKKVVGYNFRPKRAGVPLGVESLELSDGTRHEGDVLGKTWRNIFGSGAAFRPSCHVCPYTVLGRRQGQEGR